MMIDIITRSVPIKWNGVNNSPRIKLAKIKVTIGVGEITIVALDTFRYERVLYQQNNPEP